MIEDPKPPEPKTEAPKQAKARAVAAPKADAPVPEAAAPTHTQAFEGLPDLGLAMGNGGPGGVAVPQGGPIAAAAPVTSAHASPAPTVLGPRPADECTEPPVKPKRKLVSTPPYPAAAREAGVEGLVRVEVTVGVDGSVTGARILAGLGHGLDEAALEAARRASFEPAMRCGKPVVGTAVLPFRLQAMTRTAPLLLTLALASAVPVSQAAAQPRPAPTAKPAHKLTRPPKLVTFVEAPYPEAERASGKTATVKLQVAISATGTVDEAQVIESGGAAFDAAALAAMKQFVFSPAEIDDKPAPVKIVYAYTFTLKVEAPVTAVFDGVVRARVSQRPMPRVSLQVDGGPRAVTDDAGHFHGEGVPPGKHAVTLSGEKLGDLRTEETFEAGKRLDATYEIEDQEAAPGASRPATRARSSSPRRP